MLLVTVFPTLPRRVLVHEKLREVERLEVSANAKNKSSPFLLAKKRKARPAQELADTKEELMKVSLYMHLR